jgi:membrane protein
VLGDRIWQALKRNRAGRALTLLVDCLDEHHAPIAASAIAFDAFLSLVPLLAFGGLVLHLLHESGELLIRPILRASPEPVAELFESAMFRLRGSAALIAPVSSAAFLWTSSSGISTAMSIFETMFHSPPRPWWWRRGIAILCVIATIAIVAIVTATSVGIGMVSRHLGAFTAVVFPLATLIGLLSAFFRISVRKGPVFVRRRALPGVLVTVVLWAMLSALFSFYVSTLSRYATLYGGLAAVAIFLFWLWLLAMALLVGGEVNAQLDGVRSGGARSVPVSVTTPAKAESGTSP